VSEESFHRVWGKMSKEGPCPKCGMPLCGYGLDLDAANIDFFKQLGLHLCVCELCIQRDTREIHCADCMLN
jgi:hypothetical protein